MQRKTGLLFFLTVLTASLSLAAQTAYPSASPTMSVVADDGTEESVESYDGDAPMKALFRANPEDVGTYTARYEWRFTKDTEQTPFLVRYDEETEYTFMESGGFTVELYITFVEGTDTIEYRMDTPFRISLSESKLEFPNAFTPNGDGINDVFKAKEGYQSIVSFEASVYNRWGKQLYKWTDPAQGWDGRSGGSDVPDGAYYLLVKARGADGRKYNFKKTINLLRGYTETGSTAAE